MSYGTAAVDVVQSSTTGTPTQFNDGSGNQIGTLCRAWVQFGGGTTYTAGAIQASFNVSSVTVNSTGYYTVNFTNTLSDAKYSVIAQSTCNGGGAASAGPVQLFSSGSANFIAPTTSSFVMTVVNTNYAVMNNNLNTVSVFR